MIVHQTHRLHERIHGGWPDKRPASTFQVLGQSCRQIRLGFDHQRRLITEISVSPEVRRERAVLVDHLDRPMRVVDGGPNLAAVANDARVAEQPLDVPLVELCYRIRVEPSERCSEVLTLSENREPRQSRLEAFEAQLLEQPIVRRDAVSPFIVVIRHVVGSGCSPPTPRHPVLASVNSHRGDLATGR
jgi:hypothetical protein